MPAGAPAGKPRAGSAGNTPPVISPIPYTASSRGTQLSTAAAHLRGEGPGEDQAEQSGDEKLALCTQPNAPLASRLIG